MKVNKIYIINQHYFPELASTGQVFQEIAEYMALDYDVTIVAGLPFYHDNHNLVDYKIEELNQVKIRRLWNTTFPKTSFLGKIINLLTFQLSLLAYCLFIIKRDSKVMVGTNPPLAIISVALIKLIRRYELISVIQDLYPDILISSGHMNRESLLYRIFSLIIKISFKLCNTVVTISTDMKSHIESTYGIFDVKVINNMTIGNLYPLNLGVVENDRLVVMYSGNFGIAHEYKTLYESIKLLRDSESVIFKIVGGGINYNKLHEACKQANLNNVVFLPYVNKEKLNESLNQADLHLIVFNNEYRNVLMPSKYYGIISCGKPVILITEGENDIYRDIIKYDMGYYIKTGDSQKLCDILLELNSNRAQLVEKGYNALKLYHTQYDKKIVMDKYKSLLSED